MNKMFLKIMAILSLVIFVGAHGMRKRVDSPGVAQHKLDKVINKISTMTESEIKQALADMSPVLRSNYEEDLKDMPEEDKSKFVDAFSKVAAIIDSEDVDNETVDKVVEVLSKDEDFSVEQEKDLKAFGELALKEKKEKAGEQVVNDQKQSKENKDLSIFLKELSAYFNKQLNNKDKPYLVTNLVTDKANRFSTTSSDYEKFAPQVNNFFTGLQQYQNQYGYNVVCLQDAFPYFFSLIDNLYNELKTSENGEDIGNLFAVMNKGYSILNYKTYYSFTDRTEILVRNKQENGNTIADTKGYKKFVKKYEDMDSKNRRLNSSKDLGDFNLGLDY